MCIHVLRLRGLLRKSICHTWPAVSLELTAQLRASSSTLLASYDFLQSTHATSLLTFNIDIHLVARAALIS